MSCFERVKNLSTDIIFLLTSQVLNNAVLPKFQNILDNKILREINFIKYGTLNIVIFNAGMELVKIDNRDD